MKKLLFIPLLLLGYFIQAQTYGGQIKAKNNPGVPGDIARTNDQLKTSDSLAQILLASINSKLPSGASTTIESISTTGVSANTTNLFSVDMTSTPYKTIQFSLYGTWNAVVEIQGSMDNFSSDIQSIYVNDLNISNLNGIFGQQISSNGSYLINCYNYRYIRVRTTAYTSGTINSIAFGQVSGTPIDKVVSFVSLSSSAGSDGVNTRGFWAPAGGTDFLPIPNSNWIFNGSNWDRLRSVSATLNSTGAGILQTGESAQFDDVSPTSITENRFGNLRISANRNLYGTIRDAAGNERGVNVNASNEMLVTASQSGTWNINNINGTISLPTGASTLAEQQTQTTALQLIDNLPNTQGSTTSGQSGVLGMGAVTTSAPSYTTAQTSALSLQTDGSLRTAITNTVAVTMTSTTITGTVAATQSGNWNVRLQDGSGNTINSTTNALHVNVQNTSLAVTQSGSWSQTVSSSTAPVNTMNSASANSGLNAAVAGLFDDVSPTSITENSFGFLRMSANHNLYGTIRDAAGNERGANVNASNELLVAVSSIPSHAVTNAGTFPVQESGAALTALQLIDDGVVAQSTALGSTKNYLMGGSVTTAAPSYTTGNINPFSLQTDGSLRTAVTNSVTVTASNLSTNIAQINGVTPLMGNGTTGTGSPRVTLASDGTAISTTGYMSVKFDQTTPGTTNGVSLVPTTTGGLTTYHLISAASTNATNVKGSAGQLYGYYIFNANAAARKIAFHNTSGTPTAGASVFCSFVIPASSGANVEFSQGIPFSSGIAFTLVTGTADSDATAVASGDLIINLFYK